MTEEDLREPEELEKAATPGPWWLAGDLPGEAPLLYPVVRGVVDGTTRATIARIGNHNNTPRDAHNARLIAAARDALLKLIAEVRRLRGLEASR